jgi:hypothetical protein
MCIMKVRYLKIEAHSQSTGKVLDDLLNSDHDKLAHLLTIIKNIADRGGHPQPPLAKPLNGVNDHLRGEIRLKLSAENLLRIYYFVSPEENAMILLNAIIKPDGHNLPARYQGNAGHRLKRELDESIQLAIRLKIDYHLSKNNYDSLAL